MKNIPEELLEWIHLDAILKLKNFMTNEKLIELIHLFDGEFKESMEYVKNCEEVNRKDHYHKTRGTAFLLGMKKLGNECYFCESYSEDLSKEENLQRITVLENLFSESKAKLLNLLSKSIMENYGTKENTSW